MTYFWHMLDQVLPGPAIARKFRAEDLEIVTRTGQNDLVRRNGRPDATIRVGSSAHIFQDSYMSQPDINDLWPADFAPEPVQTPVGILRTQAAAFNKRFNGVVEAEGGRILSR